MKQAYLIEKKHFRVEEVNFSKLRCVTNNIILEYVYDEDNKYFTRSLFELSRLGFNIGILARYSKDKLCRMYLWDLITKLRGFNIKLGVWIDAEDSNDCIYLYNELQKKFSNNFIIGIKHDDLTDVSLPRWNHNGDIDISGTTTFDDMRDFVTILNLNTDYKTIYDENELCPISSTFDNSIYFI